MQIKINFPDIGDKSDVQPFFSSSKILSEEEKVIKQKALDTLCNLIEIEKIGYKGYGFEELFSVKKTEDCLVLEVNDKYVQED